MISLAPSNESQQIETNLTLEDDDVKASWFKVSKAAGQLVQRVVQKSSERKKKEKIVRIEYIVRKVLNAGNDNERSRHSSLTNDSMLAAGHFVSVSLFCCIQTDYRKTGQFDHHGSLLVRELAMVRFCFSFAVICDRMQLSVGSMFEMVQSEKWRENACVLGT